MAKRIGICFLALALAVTGMTGCATMDDQSRTKTEGAAAGAGLGALLGGVTGYLTGGREGAVAGAAIGAVVGGTAGYVYGSNVAAKKAQYARDEDWLDLAIAEAKKVNDDIAQYNAWLDSQYQTLKSEQEAALASNDQAKISAFNKKVATVSQSVQDKRSKVKEAIADQESVANTPVKGEGVAVRKQQLDTQIADMKAGDQAMAGKEENIKALASASPRMGT